MVRVKRGKTAHKKRENILKEAKGFRWGRKSKYRLAKDALYHSWQYSYRDRKTKKRNFRRLWQIKINAACREQEISYSSFIKALKEKNIDIDRKVLSQLAEEHPVVFEKIVEKAKS